MKVKKNFCYELNEIQICMEISCMELAHLRDWWISKNEVLL